MKGGSSGTVHGPNDGTSTSYPVNANVAIQASPSWTGRLTMTGGAALGNQNLQGGVSFDLAMGNATNNVIYENNKPATSTTSTQTLTLTAIPSPGSNSVTLTAVPIGLTPGAPFTLSDGTNSESGFVGFNYVPGLGRPRCRCKRAPPRRTLRRRR